MQSRFAESGLMRKWSASMQYALQSDALRIDAHALPAGSSKTCGNQMGTVPKRTV
jgi:hypothetical protein